MNFSIVDCCLLQHVTRCCKDGAVRDLLSVAVCCRVMQFRSWLPVAESFAVFRSAGPVGDILSVAGC